MFKSLPGFREFYPDSCAKRNYVFDTWRNCAQRYDFSEFDAPLLEPLDLYIEKSGPEIIEQLFTFEDRGGRAVALRPEMTPSLARLVGAKANAMKRPIKWFCVTENFRYERPQKGRLRSFYQFNADILGEPGIQADAELIALLVDSLCAFGLETGDFIIRLSDRTIWMLYFEHLQYSKEETNFLLALIDKWEREAPEKRLARCQEHFGDNGQNILEHLEELLSVKSFEALQRFFANHNIHSQALSDRLEEWSELLKLLKALGKDAFIRVDLGIVRGLAYYTGFVFEAFQTKGQARALAGGGRYDHLVKQLGGPELHAAGFAIGDVTLQDLLEELGKMPALEQAADYFLAYDDPDCLPALLETANKLRTQGHRVSYPLKASKLAKQLKSASDAGVAQTLIFRKDLLAEKQAILKNMATQEDQPTALADL